MTNLLQEIETSDWNTTYSIRVFSSFYLIRDEFNKIKISKKKTSIHLTRDWVATVCIAVNHSNSYTKVFSLLVWDCKWILSQASDLIQFVKFI